MLRASFTCKYRVISFICGTDVNGYLHNAYEKDYRSRESEQQFRGARNRKRDSSGGSTKSFKRTMPSKPSRQKWCFIEESFCDGLLFLTMQFQWPYSCTLVIYEQRDRQPINSCLWCFFKTIYHRSRDLSVIRYMIIEFPLEYTEKNNKCGLFRFICLGIRE